MTSENPLPSLKMSRIPLDVSSSHGKRISALLFPGPGSASSPQQQTVLRRLRSLIISTHIRHPLSSRDCFEASSAIRLHLFTRLASAASSGLGILPFSDDRNKAADSDLRIPPHHFVHFVSFWKTLQDRDTTRQLPGTCHCLH